MRRILKVPCCKLGLDAVLTSSDCGEILTFQPDDDDRGKSFYWLQSTLYYSLHVLQLSVYNSKPLNARTETWGPNIIILVQCLLPVICNPEVSCSSTEGLNLFLVILRVCSKKLWGKKKTPISGFVTCLCLSVRMEQFGSKLTDFREIWYLRIFFFSEIRCRKFMFY